MRPIRYIPPTERGRAMVEVTARTVQGRALLRPSSHLNRTFYGVLARAQTLTGTQIHAFCALSDHWHGLLSVRDARELAQFMGHVQGNLSREIGRLHDWRGPLWERRYRGIVVDEDEETQRSRFVYLLDQGCSKDGLVTSPLEWPGPSTAWALFNGESSVAGDWVDRTGLSRARRRGGEVSERDFTEQLDLVLTPLPSWELIDRNRRIRRVRHLVRTIERRVRVRCRAEDRRPIGVRAILDRHPHARPARLDRSPAPRFHAKTGEGWRRLVESYDRVVAAYRRASAELRAGNLAVVFPEGCFPPPRAFIPLPGPP